MLNETNILITTLGYTRDHLNAKYYDYKYENGEIQFCTGISDAEAGAKHVLSEHRIDEIIVIGPVSATDDNCETEERTLDNYSFSNAHRLENFSEFDFFCYRMSQYLNKIDIEANDILYPDAKDVREKIESLKAMIKSKLDRGSSGYFYQAATERDSYEKLTNLVADLSDVRDAHILHHLLYLEMSSELKMHPLRSNKEVTAKFVPVEKNSSGNFLVESMANIVNTLVSKKMPVINIHMDLQGMDKTDSYTIWSMLSMASSADTKIHLKTMICTRELEDCLSNSIDNEIKRYDIELLLAGMRSFVKYGKADILEDYFTEHEVNDPAILNLLRAIKYIDAGVSLCNISDLRFGIKALISLFNNTVVDSNSNENTEIFLLLKDGIQHDYGALLDGDDVDVCELISWALRKQFYQQALTMIESLVPGDIVKRGIYYYAHDDSDIPNVMRAWNVLFWNEIPKNRYCFNDLNHFFIKSYGRAFINFRQAKDMVAKDLAKSRIDQLYSKNPEMCKAFSALNNDAMLYEFLLSYYNIGNLRNLVSHAQPSDTVMPSLVGMKDNQSFNLCNDAISKFLAIYQSVCRHISKTDVCPKLIEDWHFRAYTGNHRLRPLETAPENLLMTDSYSCQFNGKDIEISIRMLAPEDDVHSV